jgi:hypothetical protein
MPGKTLVESASATFSGALHSNSPDQADFLCVYPAGGQCFLVFFLDPWYILLCPLCSYFTGTGG